MKVALILPPFTQLNTPYPSISYLKRKLNQLEGIEVSQRDLGIELALTIYSSGRLSEIFEAIDTSQPLPEEAWQMLSQRRKYENTIDPVIAFLQGKDKTLATRIHRGSYLPIGPRLSRANTSPFGQRQ